MGFAQINVMSEFKECWSILNSGLFGVKFPGMQIKEVCTLFSQDRFNSHCKERGGDQAEVGTSSPRNDLIAQFKVADWKLVKSAMQI